MPCGLGMALGDSRTHGFLSKFQSTSKQIWWTVPH